MKAALPFWERRLLPGVLWAASGALFFSALSVPLYDADLWWHLAAGREMVERGVFLRHDIFSHTLLGAPWTNVEWLGQVLVYGLVDAGGAEALFYAKIFLSLAAVAVLAALLRACGARGPVWLLGVWAGFLVLRPRLFERLELATLILLPAFFLALLRGRSAGRTERRVLAGLLALSMALWCNIHFGFVYGAGLVVLVSLGARWAKEDRSYLRFLDITAAAVILSAWATPHGWNVVPLYAEVMEQLKSAGGLIAEWQEADVRATPFFWLLFLASGSGLAAGLLKDDRAARFWAPAIFAFAVWGSRHYRSTVLLAAPGLAFLVEFLARRFPAPSAVRRRAGWAVCALLISMQAAPLARSFPAEKILRSRAPDGACRFLEAQNVRGKMFNSYSFGGHISWALGPERKIFMDGRYLFYPLLQEQRDVLSARVSGDEDAPARFFLKYGVDHSVVDYTTVKTFPREGGPVEISAARLMFPPEDWALVYWDDAAMVFLKRLPRWDALIRQKEYETALPHRPEETERLLKIDRAAALRLGAELDRHAREAGFTVTGSHLRRMLEQAALPAGKTFPGD
ncbi:MAG: hypothetical protein ACT4O3_08760 [Elusimicrobiota bacterium]